jgi:septal ring factor EnvC (AmiA/AmiB activator)
MASKNPTSLSVPNWFGDVIKRGIKMAKENEEQKQNTEKLDKKNQEVTALRDEIRTVRLELNEKRIHVAETVSENRALKETNDEQKTVIADLKERLKTQTDKLSEVSAGYEQMVNETKKTRAVNKRKPDDDTDGNYRERHLAYLIQRDNTRRMEINAREKDCKLLDSMAEYVQSLKRRTSTEEQAESEDEAEDENEGVQNEQE